MANLNITEMPVQGRDPASDRLPIGQLPGIAVQNVAIGGSSTQSSAFDQRTGMIRVRADLSCAVLVGTNPTALTTSVQLDAGAAEYFAVPIGQSYKIAVIAI